MPERAARWLLSAALLSTGLVAAGPCAAADFSGVWVPVPESASIWTPLPAYTAAGASALRDYDRQRHDSALFCMPLGTPRNMLVTAPYPIEILQRDEQLTVIFDGRGDVRRIYLDGRGHPPEPFPNWMGHSVGHWDGDQLRIDTVAMTAESRMTDDGMPHSEALHLAETWELTGAGSDTVLRVSLTLDDPVTLQQPITTERYFRRSPRSELTETAIYCLLDQWRAYLERHNKDLSMQLRDPDDGEAATP